MRKKVTGFVSVCMTVALCLAMLPTTAWALGDTFATISTGSGHSMAVKQDGTLWAWGRNDKGQLGDGTTDYKDSPVKVMDNVAAVSAGDYQTLAIKTDGTLWAWGQNDAGQLGDGTKTDKSSPVKIMDGVAAVSAGKFHSLAIKTDGTLWSWGGNNGGQLGDGTWNDRSSPVKIMDGVATVSAGAFHTLAVKTDGSLWSWGSNAYYALGDGTDDSKSSPVKIMDGVATMSAGNAYTLVIKTDGALWSWGYDLYGQLGDGSISDSYRSNPEKIMDDVAAVSAGTFHTLAIKTDGTLWAWGLNTDGELGNGTLGSHDKEYSSPTKILDGVAAISAGNEHTLAIKTDGTLWAWGRDNYGELGNVRADENATPHNVLSGVKLSASTSAPPTQPTPPAPAAVTAAPTASIVLVNGQSVAFDAYNINGNNYFKLRDLAYALNGSAKQFEVAWDGANNAISLISGKAYTAVGGEMTGKGSGNKTGTPTTSKILLDGKEVSFTAYNIDGNNYFKLRDIGLAFDFGIEWDGAKNTIVIDTSKGYTPD